MPKDSLLSSKAFKQEDFGGLYREARDLREKRQYLALFLLQRTDLSVQGVASMLNVSVGAVYNWLNHYHQRSAAVTREDTDADQKKPTESFAGENFTRLYRNAKNPDSKIRYLALSLLQPADRSVDEVASILRVSRTAVYDWLNCYREKGIQGIGGGRGRKRILSPEQERLVEELAGRFAKESYKGVGGRLLQQELVKRGIRCSEASVYRWLARARRRKKG